MKNWTHKIGSSEFKVIRMNDAAVGQPLHSPDDMVNYLLPQLGNSFSYRRDVENLVVIHLTTRHDPIGFEIVSNGTLDTILIHPREVFKSAIVMNAAAIVLFHNHPSGNPTPSDADIKVTRDMKRAGELLKIQVIDHIILGKASVDRPKSYHSLRESGYFY